MTDTHPTGSPQDSRPTVPSTAAENAESLRPTCVCGHPKRSHIWAIARDSCWDSVDTGGLWACPCQHYQPEPATADGAGRLSAIVARACMGANLEPIGRGNNDGTICSKDGGIAVDCFGHEGNAEFLSHAQADVLWLVDEVRSLRAALATAERERDQLAEIDAFVRERLGDPRLADVPLKLLLEGVLVQRAGLLEQCATLTQERDAWNEAAADLTERLYQEGVKLAASESRARALREALIHRCASARIDPECEDCQQIIALIDQDGPGAAPSGEA